MCFNYIKIYLAQCEICGKIIYSTTQKQAEYNLSQHFLKHHKVIIGKEVEKLIIAIEICVDKYLEEIKKLKAM